MTDALKWTVAVASFALLGGAFFAGQKFSKSGTPRVDIVSTTTAGYPAPEVSVVAQVVRDHPRSSAIMLSRASGQYSEGSSYSRRRRSGRSSKPKPKPQLGEIDQEMGMMAADNQKLREAMERANRMERDGGNPDAANSEP